MLHPSVELELRLQLGDHVGSKRKHTMTGLKDQYDPYFVVDDVYKEVEKIKAKGKTVYYKSMKFYHPYCATKPKPKDGLFENLVSHAHDASRSEEDAKMRAQHATLPKALTPV
ncbi:hypothetical protein D1007_37963 [Hordeum vulgare]|nr:hypothetical protein D1007_37963 [Hordeum vulgare]